MDCPLQITIPSLRHFLILKVKDIIEQHHKVCNVPIIYNMFDHNTTQLILNTPLQPLVTEDKLIWKA